MIINKFKIIMVIAMFLLATSAFADQVTATFNTGETLDSVKLGDLVTQINDNDNELTAVQIQTDVLVDACSAGSSIRSIAADGTVACEIDDDTTYSAGSGISLNSGTISVDSNITITNINYSTPKIHYLSIPAEAFVSASGYAVRTSWGNGGAYVNTPISDALVAPVYLPDGATMTGFDFYYFDNDAAQDMTAWIKRASITTAGTSIVQSLDSSGTPSLNASSKSATPFSAGINNSAFGYAIRVFATWPGNNSLRISSVRITYTIDSVE